MTQRSETAALPGLEAAIGGTPMVRLKRLPPAGAADLFVKLEFLNPGGSVKDRAALAVILDAEARGDLRPGGTIIEATGGNMGLALAMIGAARGYTVVIVLPEGVAEHHLRRLQHYGAETVQTRAVGGMAEALRTARRLRDERPGFWMVDQFNNPSVVRAHREGTGPEILRGAGRRIDAFVAGVGTGGTITGVGGALKAHDPATTIVAVEPARSLVLSGGRPAPHRIAGIGADFVPPLLDRAIVDKIIPIADEEAYQTMKDLAAREGLVAGPSSGANVAAALQIASGLGPGRVVVTILADSGEHYLHAGM
jgi:cysteine synthase A